MKKKIFGLLVIVSLLFVTACSNENAKLKEIAEKFNGLEDIKSMAEYGTTYKATVSKSSLTIEISGKDVESKSLEYKLDGNILSGEFKEEDSLVAGISTVYLVDSIAQINGYKPGEIISTINDERISEYTVAKEGFEVSEGETLKVKIDITKKIPLLDFSNTYITVEDLESAKEYLIDGSYDTYSTGLHLNSFYSDGEYVVKIGEENGLTMKAYNSLSSFLEVVFNDAAVSYLNDNYSLSDGSKEFAGIKIEYDVKLSEDDFSVPNDSYKVMRVTIDKDAFFEAIK